MKSAQVCLAAVICAVVTISCQAQSSSLQSLIGQKLYGCQGIQVFSADAHSAPIFLSRNLELTVSKIWVSSGTMQSRSKVSVLFSFGNSDPMALLSGQVDNVYLEKVPIRIGNLADILNQSLDPSGVGLRVSPVGYVQKGSTYSDMICMFGHPQHSNDYGDSTQYSYDDGSTLIYIDNSSQVVTNIQRFSSN